MVLQGLLFETGCVMRFVECTPAIGYFQWSIETLCCIDIHDHLNERTRTTVTAPIARDAETREVVELRRLQHSSRAI